MSAGAIASSAAKVARDGEAKVFTVICAGDIYGLPIDSVQTIFRVGTITPIPLAPPEILGLINLRGRVNIATSLRLILGVPDPGNYQDALAICVERHGEQFALIVDKIGDVVTISESARIHEPPNVERRRASLTAGLFSLDRRILPVLDVDLLLDFGARQNVRATSGHRQEGSGQ